MDVSDYALNNKEQQDAAAQQAHVGFLGDVLGSFNNALMSQERGTVQLSNELFGTKFEEPKMLAVDDPNSSWSAWAASQLGQGGAVAAELFVAGKVTKGLIGKEGAAAAGTFNARMKSSVAIGALIGGVMTPTDDRENFWQDRLRNTVGDMVTFGTMTAASAGIAGAAEKLGAGKLGSVLRNDIMNTTVSGFAGGVAGDMTWMALDGQTPKFSLDYWKHVGTAGAKYAVANFGMASFAKAVDGSPLVHSDATIGENVELGKYTKIGRIANIGNGVKTGEGVKIDSEAVIGNGARIGDESRIMENSVLGDNVRLGANVIAGKRSIIGDGAYIADAATLMDGVSVNAAARVGAGAKLGSDVLVDRYAQVGDRVSVGSGSHVGVESIVSNGAALGQRVDLHNAVNVGNNAVLDDLVIVLPGAKIGAGARLHEGAGISLSAEIGEGAQIGAHAYVGKSARIGKNATVENFSIVPAGTVVPDNGYWPSRS